ncbi:MAG: hypothetical protein JKX91_05890 [Rhizobiaceae bacterium]|nr:hypothetical protein [Rhizobiaceae bacterium]
MASNLIGYVLYSAAEGVGTSTTYIDTEHLAVGLVWVVVESLTVKTEYYTNESDYVLATNDTDTDGFIIRITRS